MESQHAVPEIRKVVVLNAPIEKVWKAVATSEGIAAWWMPNTFEPVVGHSFILHTDHHGDSPCKVTVLEPMKRVGFDWDKDWHLTFELKQLDDGKTEFTLVHSGWNAENSGVRDIMNGGWEKIVTVRLRACIEV